MFDDFVEAGEGLVRHRSGEAEADGCRLVRSEIEPVDRCRFGTSLGRVDRCPLVLDEGPVKGIFHIAGVFGRVAQHEPVGFVSGEPQLFGPPGPQPVSPEDGMLGADSRRSVRRILPNQDRRRRDVPHGSAPVTPRPRVPEPYRGEHVALGRGRTTVRHAYRHQQIVRSFLGVDGVNVEVAALIEHPGVGQLEFWFCCAAASIDLHQVLVGKGRLGIEVAEM